MHKAMSPATTIARDGCGHPASLWLAVKGPSLSAWAAQQGGENQGHGTQAARSATCRRRQATQRGVYSERKATTGPRWGTSGRLWKGGERCRKRRRGARRACMQAHKNASSLQAATCQNCLCKATHPRPLAEGFSSQRGATNIQCVATGNAAATIACQKQRGWRRRTRRAAAGCRYSLRPEHALHCLPARRHTPDARLHSTALPTLHASLLQDAHTPARRQPTRLEPHTPGSPDGEGCGAAHTRTRSRLDQRA